VVTATRASGGRLTCAGTVPIGSAGVFRRLHLDAKALDLPPQRRAGFPSRFRLLREPAHDWCSTRKHRRENDGSHAACNPLVHIRGNSHEPDRSLSVWENTDSFFADATNRRREGEDDAAAAGRG
jgi:hypothetical protein